MPTLQEGLAILVDTIKGKKTHKHYKHVTKLAELYKKLITGKDIGDLLKQFVRREDDVMFDQRKQMTQQITPSVSSAIMNPFYKVPRNNSVVEKIDFEKQESFEEKKKDVDLALSKYNGDKSLKEYMDSRFVDISFCDPNAFIVTEFDAPQIGPKGEMLEKVQPRPFEVSSYNAINFKYRNNILQWLIVMEGIHYKVGEKEEEGFSYTIYLENDAIKFTQIDPKSSSYSEIGKIFQSTISINDKTKNVLYIRISEKELYLVEEFNHKAGFVPAKRVGYRNDLVTEGETYVNPMHDAMPYFMKSIKTVSEFDLTMCLSAYAQKFQYVNRCTGYNKIGCDNGTTPEGSTCIKCNGSGFSIHTSAQDAVVLRMPKDPSQIIDLEKLVHYEHPPVDILKFQNEFILQLKQESKQAVFNSEAFQKTDGTQTATELDYSYEAVYDTLFSFAQAYSNMYKYIVKCVAAFRDIYDLKIEYKFPKDFKLKTVSDLLNELKQANDSNAPGYVKQELSLDIAEQQFIDKPEELKRIRIKQSFFPFPDKTPTEIVYVVSNGLTTEYDKVLWANFDNIFSGLEKDATKINKYFYDYAPEIQEQKIKEKVTKLIENINSSKPEVIDFRDTEETAIQDNSNPGQQT